MNKAFLTIGLVLMAILGFYSISVISNQQNGAELDYYLLKETTEASMNDAIDIVYYRQFGTVRMDKEKFMESFVKRFAVGVDGTRDYDIEVYDLNETPPKVSVKVVAPKSVKVVKGINKGTTENVDITTQVDMIVEEKNKKNIAAKTQYRQYVKDLKSISGFQFNTVIR